MNYSLISFQRFAICLKKLASVDDTLEELGTPKIYQKMHIWSRRIVIGWFVCSLTENFYESFGWMRTRQIVSWAMCIPQVFNWPFQINTFVDLLFISVLWFVQYFKYLVIMSVWILVYANIFLSLKLPIHFLIYYVNRYIGTRFDKVNEHMRNVLARKKQGCTWKKRMVINCRYVIYIDNYKRTLWILM